MTILPHAHEACTRPHLDLPPVLSELRLCSVLRKDALHSCVFIGRMLCAVVVALACVCAGSYGQDMARIYVDPLSNTYGQHVPIS